jgi:hypothetical protein
LQIYLPDRDDEQVVIDKPIHFQVLALINAEYGKLESKNLENIAKNDLKATISGQVFGGRLRTHRPPAADEPGLFRLFLFPRIMQNTGF